MPFKRIRRVDAAGRRRVLKASLGAGAAAIGIAASARGANAQGDAWWQSIIGHGSQLDRRQRAAERRAKRAAQLRDLRDNDTPWLSDVMLESTQSAIERYRKLVSIGGWPTVPGPRLMRPGDDDERVPILRRRLRIEGDLGRATNYYESYSFDGELEAAVAAFQTRHGLRVSGRVDRPTFAALNVTAPMRLSQLQLNLSRLREMMRERIEDRYIFVNVPAYQLEAVERFEVRQRHRVIVGRPGRDTPSIKATIRALNFFPYWRVPISVARLDLIPRLQKEPEYLAKEHIRAVQGHFNGPEVDTSNIDWSQVDPTKVFFKQDPGEWNALGLVRIDMPNKHTVYMHDTPMKELFNQSRRAYSAGCVRVQDVMKLAEWIASYETGWQEPGRSKQVVAAGEALTVDLTRPVPVYFSYITAWGEPDGTIQFRPDIYDRDGARELAGDIDPEAPEPRVGLAP